MAQLIYEISGNANGLTAAVRNATGSLNTLEQSANRTNNALRNDITSIKQLQETLKRLNREKLNIVDAGQLATQNRRIQELTAEITRLQRAGTVGFDQFGNAIQRANGGLANLGVGLTRGLGYLRTFAYIVPGLGIAGIFNLAFEGITAAANALGVFNFEVEKSAKELAKAKKEEEKAFGKDSFIDGAKSLSDLSQKIQLAKNGFLDKNKVLKEYNDTLGLTIGRVDSLGAAEQKIIDKGPAYLQFLLLKARAEFAFRKAAEDSYNIAVQQNKFQESLGTPLGDAKSVIGKLAPPAETKQTIKNIDDVAKAFLNNGNAVTDNIQKINLAQLKGAAASENFNNKTVSSLNKTATASQRIANQAQKVLEDFAKSNGLNLFGYTQDSAGVNAGQQQLNLANQLSDIIEKVNNQVGKSGLSGYALEIEKISQFYSGVNTQIEEFITKVKQQQDLFTKSKGKSGLSKKDGQDLINQAIGFQSTLGGGAFKELFDAEFKERQRVLDEIQRINDAFGVKQEQNRAKELAQLKAFYDKEVALAKGNAQIISALNTGLPIAQAAINKKYDDKNAEGFYNALNKAIKTSNKAADKEESELARVISRSLRNFGQSFIETLSSAETYAKGTFTSIFSDLTTKLTSSLNGIFQNIVLDGLSKSLSQAISNGTSGLFKDGKITGLGGAIAGGGLLGGILSAATPQTSTIGQAGGGLLSGAASGAAIGSIIPGIGTVAGAIAGGLIGAIGGIFGSSSARKKQEELQKQQLEESKKQTELLRQAQAAYTSQIIGRFTQFGTISGINVGAYGQLIATVSGRDLQFILDRNNNGR